MEVELVCPDPQSDWMAFTSENPSKWQREQCVQSTEQRQREKRLKMQQGAARNWVALHSFEMYLNGHNAQNVTPF